MAQKQLLVGGRLLRLVVAQGRKDLPARKDPKDPKDHKDLREFPSATLPPEAVLTG
jgi:hypothetical protein